jgi:hypothetical protein
MTVSSRFPGTFVLLVAVGVAPVLQATADPDHCIQQFLARDDAPPAYRAVRRLEAVNGSRSGWLEAVTEYAPATGFRYQVRAEGGNASIRDKVLRAILDAEKDVIARGEVLRSLLIHDNYTFEPKGVDEQGLVTVLVSPRRKEPALVSGHMSLAPDGRLVRLQGQLAKSPSFWIKSVAVTRTYDRIAGSVVPVALESRAQTRMFGPATLHMTYHYSHINGQPVAASAELTAGIITAPK